MQRRLASTVWYLVKWLDLGKGEYGMHRGTRAASSFWSSVHSAVGLLRGVVLLLVPVAMHLRGVVLLLVPFVVLRREVVLLLVHVVAHLPRVAALPKAVAAESQFPMTSSNAK